MLEDKPGIYCIENIITCKKYIGQSHKVKSRINKHISELNCNSHFNDYLQKAWNKYGQDNFIYYVLEYCNEVLLDERECYYIELYNTTNRDVGYNLKSGGQNGGSVLSEGSRKKISESLKRVYSNEDQREIQRQNALRQWANPEIKAKICGENSGRFGKHLSEDAKRRIGNAQRGRISYKRNLTPVFCEELQQRFQDASTAGKQLLIDSCGILKVCRNERYTCGGYHWKFVE